MCILGLYKISIQISHISSIQQTHKASGYHFAQNKYRKCWEIFFHKINAVAVHGLETTFIWSFHKFILSFP